MPSMANITVKKADGTTDVTYVAATPSAGDKVPAIWTQNTGFPIQGFRPRLQLMTLSNGGGNQRRAEVSFSYPFTYTDPATSLTKLNKSVDIKATVHLPVELATTEWKEAFAQLGNLLTSALVRSSIEEGYAPT